VGYDLYARRTAAGDGGYFRATIGGMSFLRAAMNAAGVPRQIVYGKLLGNDGVRVTELQGKAIAERLTAWLGGRNLVVDLREPDDTAAAIMDEFSGLLDALAGGRARPRRRRPKQVEPEFVKLGRRDRAWIRAFADFCARSGGFRVC